MDIEGYSIAGGTVPPHIMPTTQKPDICIVWEAKKKVCLVELTVPFEMNIDHAHTRKLNRYASLKSDLESNDWSVIHEPIEIGARGLITKDNKLRLLNLVKMCLSNVPTKNFLTSLSKSSILSSFVIFYSRHEATWNNMKILDM